MSNDKFTKILVVEDSADDSFMLFRLLEKAQLDDHVTFVDDGKKALDLLSKMEKTPLAVFLDLKLPGMDGVHVLKHMRGEEKLKDLPVIVMTGSTDPKLLDECRNLGVKAVLPKPVELATFIRTVAHLFPRKPTSF